MDTIEESNMKIKDKMHEAIWQGLHSALKNHSNYDEADRPIWNYIDAEVMAYVQPNDLRKFYFYFDKAADIITEGMLAINGESKGVV